MQKLKELIFGSFLLLMIVIPLDIYAQNIYWLESDFNSPRLVKTDSSGNELLSHSLPAGSLPQSIALNRENNQLFWTGLSFINARINNISVDFNSSSVIIDNQSVLRGLTIDPINEKLYWISTNLIDGPKIWQADLNGQSQTVLIDFGPASNSTPRCLALDTDRGTMYWTNFGEGKIQRADAFTGTPVEDIISGLNGPFGIDIDMASGRIFFTEMNGHQIKSADMDGNNVTLLLDGLSYPNQISVNSTLNKMAWTEIGTGKIKLAALDGTNVIAFDSSATAPTGIIIESPAPVPPLSGNLQIVPRDTTIQLFNYLQYKAQIVDSLGVAYPTQAGWFVKRDRVGPISQEGLLFSYFPGKAKIMAKRDSMVAKAVLTVIDTTRDSSAVNRIKIIGKFQRGKDKHYKALKEGQTYTIGGLPSPFNIINGSMIYFPKGCLNEDITLEIELPKFHKIKKDSIHFANQIINGIEFNVFAGDSLIEPYYFDRPLSISIPFKRGLLKKYGADPLNLSLFYAIDSTTFDSAGISHVTVDTSQNRIYAVVEHFSSLVIREKENTNATTDNQHAEITPEYFELKQNYPNPFNPVTMISYQLPLTSDVTLSVYNMLGQKIATLVNKKQQAGSYSIPWDASGFATGIYIYTLETNTGFRQSRKLILIK